MTSTRFLRCFTAVIQLACFTAASLVLLRAPSAAQRLAAHDSNFVKIADAGLPWITSIAFSPDGRRLAVGGLNRASRAEVRVLTLPLGTGARSLRCPDDDSYGGADQLRKLAFSSDGQKLAVATHRGVLLWDATTDEGMEPLFGYDQQQRIRYLRGTQGLAFAPNGTSLVTGPALEFWDVAKQSVVWAKDRVTAGGVTFSPDGKLVATAEYHNRVHLWKADTGEQLAEVHGQMGPLYAATFRPDGKLLAVGGEGGVRIWEIRRAGERVTFEECPRLKGDPPPSVRSLAFSPDGEQLAAAAVGLAKLWDIATWEQVATPDRDAFCVAFSPDGKTLATAGSGNVRMWQLDKLLEQEAVAARSRQAAADLMKAMISGRNERAMGKAFNAIGPQSAAAVPVLQKALEDPDPDVRSTVAFALLRIGPAAKAAVPSLMKALEDEAPEVRRAARMALQQISDGRDLQEKIRTAPPKPKTQPKAERRGGTYYFEGRSLENWTELLGKHYVPNEIFGRSSRARPAAAIQAIGPQAVPTLIKALESDNWATRVGAADVAAKRIGGSTPRKSP